MRKARTTDIPQIIELLKESFSHAWKKTNREFHKKFVARNILKGIKKDIVLVEKKQGKIIGFGWAKRSKDFFGNKIGEITLVLISPKHQNKGLGTKLIKRLEKELKVKDLRLECLSNIPAKRLYGRNGYKEFLIILRKTKN